MVEARTPLDKRLDKRKLPDALKRLRELDLSKKRSEVREAWQLAQAITSVLHPSLQLELDSVRAAIMSYLQEGREGKSISLPSKTRWAQTWRAVQVTPDLHHDHGLEGRRVPEGLVRQLKKAIRAQIYVIEPYLYGGR